MANVVVIFGLLVLNCSPVVCISAMENVTRLLDELLRNYKKEVRPGLGGGPLHIHTNILVRSMGPVEENELSYSMQCYLRQSWYDERLQFNLENVTEVTLSNSFLKDIWKPNTFFLNGRRSTQPNITVPNVFVRIRNDGSIYMSRRLTIHALCPMKLRNYPMDRPICPLQIGGYGYTTKDVIYIWQFGIDRSVEVYDDVTMSQFDIDVIMIKNVTEKNDFGEFSVLEVYFHLKRHIGFFLIQTYLPCTLIVFLSWVSFWINRDAAPARVLLGVTTILSTAAIGLIQRDGLPRVAYATALDVYLNVCIVYNLAAMIQYAAVNYFTKVIPQDGGKNFDEKEEMELLLAPHTYVAPDTKRNENGTKECSSIRPKPSNCGLFLRCLVGNFRYQRERNDCSVPHCGNSVSKIDIISRYLFPASFGLFHLVYWLCYLDFYLN